MSFFANPRNLVEAFGLSLRLFRLTGLFPYHYNDATNEFHISWKLFIITILHLTIYAYVNITSLLENWYDYSQPMIGHSSLTAFGNLNLRLLDITITFLVFIPPLLGNHLHVASLNRYMKVLDELVLMGINVSGVYRRLYYLSCAFLVVCVMAMTFSAWHSIYFFKQITERPPELKYYLVVTLSNFYKLLFMFYGNSQLFALFMISKQINCYLEDLIREYREQYEKERSLKSELFPQGV